jgi:glutamyl-tRNA synthetase
MILRLEDLDGPRIRPEDIDKAIEDLQWLGLDWDEGPFLQTPRADRYQEVFTSLLKADLIYPCTCSRKDVESAASAPHPGDEGPVYPGTCRGRWKDPKAAAAEIGVEPCWRFKVDSDLVVEWQDRFAGPRRVEVARELGDFVVWKKGGGPSYQLAVVVDDADQGVDEVLRGDDLLPSTARQVLLWEFLGPSVPSFAHVPLVVGRDGRRLAKRHGDTTLALLREKGISSEEVTGLLASWSGLVEVPGPLRPCDLLDGFDLAKVPRDPVVWPGDWPSE